MATYRYYVVPVWSLELTVMHIGKPEATDSGSCVFPFNEVPVWKSMGAEFIGSLALGIAPGLIMEHPILVIVTLDLKVYHNAADIFSMPHCY